MTEEQEPWLCTILRWISRWKGPPAVVRPSSAPDERAPVGPGAALSGGFAQIVNTSFNDRGKPILRAAPALIRPSLAQACAPITDRYARVPFGLLSGLQCACGSMLCLHVRVRVPMPLRQRSRRPGCL